MKLYLMSFAIIISLILLSCSDNNVDSDDDNIVKIGVLLPQTGSGSSTGEGIKVALDTYLQNYNSLLVQRSFRIELVYKNTETNPSICLDKLTELNNANIKIIIGPYSSSEIEFIKDYVKQNKILILSPSSVASSLSIPDDNIFRFAPNDSTQAIALNEYLRHKDIRYLAGTYRDDLWGHDISNKVASNHIFKGNFADNFYSYKSDLTNLKSSIGNLAQKVKYYHAQDNIANLGLYFASFNEGTDVLNEMLETTLSSHTNMQLIGSSAFANNSTILNSSKAANFAITQNMVCPVIGVPEANKTNVYYNSINQQLGREAESYAFVAYDIIDLIISSIHSSKYYESKNIDNLIESMIGSAKNWDGLSGNLELDANGDRKNAIYDFKGIRKKQDKYEWYTKSIYYYINNRIVDVE